MVVWLTGIYYLRVLVGQSSLTVLRPSQAFHDIICHVSVESCSIFFPIVAYRTCHCIYAQKKRVAGEVSLTLGVVIGVSGWFA